VKAGRAAAAAEPSRVPELDGLRGLAVLSVVCWHYLAGRLEPALGPMGALADRALGLSWSGVDLFFVLSGFLIGGILIDHRESPRYFSSFYARRACRILPAYAVIVVLAFLWSAGAERAGLRIGFGNLLPAWSYATFTQNFVMASRGTFGSHWLGPTWSLAIEEQFYLLLPVLVRMVPPARLPAVLAAGILAGPVSRVALLAFHPRGFFAAYVMMPGRADALLLGALLAWAWRRGAVREAVQRHGRVLHALLVVLLAGLVVLAVRGENAFTRTMQVAGYSWLALTYLVVLMLALGAPRGPVASVARWRWLGLMGTISYAVYLLHHPVLRLVYGFAGAPISVASPRGALLMVLAAGLTLALAALSWRFFEGPLVRRGRSFRY
jgi:peptidoglycan/LPS O-acetylase OafA/YrhL